MAIKLVEAEAWRAAAKTVDKGILSAEAFQDSVGLMKYSTYEVRKVKPDDKDDLELEFIISDDSVDRMSDRISQRGIDLTNFKKNPVVLWAHDSHGLPVARAIKTYREKDKETKTNLTLSIARFMEEDLNPFSYMIYRMCTEGFLNACSVGLRIIKYTKSEDEARPYGYDFEETDLLEWSVVPIPANPNALAKAHEIGIDTDPLRDWAVRVLDDNSFRGITRTEVEGAWKRLRSKAIIIDVSKSDDDEEDDTMRGNKGTKPGAKKGADETTEEETDTESTFGLSVSIAGKPIKVAAGTEVSFRVGDDGELELTRLGSGLSDAEEDGDADDVERDADTDDTDDTEDDGEESKSTDDDESEEMDMEALGKELADIASAVIAGTHKTAGE